jgi:hypothetical protein
MEQVPVVEKKSTKWEMPEPYKSNLPVGVLDDTIFYEKPHAWGWSCGVCKKRA